MKFDRWVVLCLLGSLSLCSLPGRAQIIFDPQPPAPSPQSSGVIEIVFDQPATSTSPGKTNQDRAAQGYLSLPKVEWLGTKKKADRPLVTQLFSYACADCEDIERQLTGWKVTKGGMIFYHRVPWYPSMDRYSEILPALKWVGAEDMLHNRVYRALHRDKLKIDDDRYLLLKWLPGQLETPEQQKRVAMLASFGVNRWRLYPFYQLLVSRGKEVSRKFEKEITDVPALIIDTPKRTLITSPKIAGGRDALIPALNRMLDAARDDYQQETGRYLTARLGNSLTEEQKSLIEYDLQVLRTLKLHDPKGKLRRTFEIAEASGPAVEKWLADRITFIVGPGEESVDFDMTDGFKSGSSGRSMVGRIRYPDPIDTNADFYEVNGIRVSNAVYKFLKQFMRLYEPKDGIYWVDKSKISDRAAASISIGSYLRGNIAGRLFATRVGDKIFPIYSQRHGIITLAPDDRYWRPAKDFPVRHILNVIDRLATLIHEARHGDGPVLTGAGVHVDCPKNINHQHAGKKGGCDPWGNGSYALDHLFIKAAYMGCQDCSPDPAFNARLRKMGAEMPDLPANVLSEKFGDARALSIFDVPQDDDFKVPFGLEPDRDE